MTYTISKICTKIEANRKEILKKALKEYIIRAFMKKVEDIKIEFDEDQKVKFEYILEIDENVIDIANKTIDAVIEFLEWERVKDRIEKTEEKD